MEFDATFLIVAISFVIFVLIMNKIFYAPILKIMQERQAFIDNNYNDSKIIKKETSEKEQYYNSELDKARDEAREKIDTKARQFKDDRSLIIADYKKELQQNILQQKEDMKNSARQAKDELKSSVVDIAKDISSKIMGNNFNVESINESEIEEK